MPKLHSKLALLSAVALAAAATTSAIADSKPKPAPAAAPAAAPAGLKGGEGAVRELCEIILEAQQAPAALRDG